MNSDSFRTLREFDPCSGRTGRFYSLPALEQAGVGRISRLPHSIRIVLEAVLRNCDGTRVTEDHVRKLAAWTPTAPRTDEIPFVVSRILLQDFTGVPLLCDLAAMRGAARRMGRDPSLIEPFVPVDLVIDHSVQVDAAGTPDALAKNMALGFQRNEERYRFLKWGMNAFRTFRVVPPDRRKNSTAKSPPRMEMLNKNKTKVDVYFQLNGFIKQSMNPLRENWKTGQ